MLSPKPDKHPRPLEQGKTGPAAMNLLVVDDEPTTGQLLENLPAGTGIVVHRARTLAQGRSIAQGEVIHVAVVGLKLPDGDGLELAGELRKNCPTVRSIVVTGRRSYRGALDAMRAGASDYLPKPFKPAEVTQCLDRALRRRDEVAKNAQRIERLRKLCKELTQARQSMGKRVGTICNDLTSAYQDLAGQVKHAQLIGRFKAAVEQELDLEKVLRRFLEVVLHEVGATNAVVFLPSMAGSFAVGGYINYNLEKGALEVMLQHLGEVAAPALAECEGPKAIAGAGAIREWLGVESRWLEARSVLALPCRHDKELLAGLLLFREPDQRYDAATAQALDAIAPILAAHLSKVVHIHHRLKPNDEALDHGDGADPDEMQF